MRDRHDGSKRQFMQRLPRQCTTEIVDTSKIEGKAKESNSNALSGLFPEIDLLRYICRRCRRR